MTIPFGRLEGKAKRNFDWMRESVRVCFAQPGPSLNVGVMTQICCYTDSLSRYRAGITKELAKGKVARTVFCDFMREYFNGFAQAAAPLKTFPVCTWRELGKRQTAELDAFEAFFQIYRHGLVHEFLQKSKSMITRSRDEKRNVPYLRVRENKYGVKVSDGTKTRRLHVHMDPLVADFDAAVTSYEHDLLSGPGAQELQQNYCDRYEFVIRWDTHDVGGGLGFL